VIPTKSDIACVKAIVANTRTAEEVCREKDVPCVLWVDNSRENGDVSISHLAYQTAELRAAFSKVQPWSDGCRRI